jgi:hypothetical protein
LDSHFARLLRLLRQLRRQPRQPSSAARLSPKQPWPYTPAKLDMMRGGVSRGISGMTISPMGWTERDDGRTANIAVSRH